MRGVLRPRSIKPRLSSRRLRQRWRWVPLPVRLKVAQLRGRLAHRRVVVRVAVAILVGAVVVGLVARPTPAVQQVEQVTIPNDHRVLSMPIDERVPRLEPGDQIDLYLGTDGLARVDDEISIIDEPGIITLVTESAFSVAVPETAVVTIAAALRDGGVLVVRR